MLIARVRDVVRTLALLLCALFIWAGCGPGNVESVGPASDGGDGAGVSTADTGGEAGKEESPS